LDRIELRELERKLREIKPYSQRVLATLLLQAQCYDDTARLQFEAEAQRLVARLANDPDGLSSLLRLALAANAGGQQLFKFHSAERARIERQVKKETENLEIDKAIAAAQQTVRRKPARTIEYAEELHPHVLAAWAERFKDIEPKLRPRAPSAWKIMTRISPRKAASQKV
jgi:hypothetical protein